MIHTKVFNSYDEYDSYMKSQISSKYEDIYEELSEEEKNIMDNTIIPSYNESYKSICILDYYHQDYKFLILAFIFYVLKNKNQVIYVTDTTEKREYIQSHFPNESITVYSLEEYLNPYREKEYLPIVIFDNIDECSLHKKIYSNFFEKHFFTLIINYK